MQFALNCLKFEDIREQIIQGLNSNSPYAGQFDFRSSNLSYFVDVMTYVSMLISYNTSHIANNKFLGATEIRKNGVARAGEIGYTPKRPYAAKFSGKLIYKGTNFGPSNSLTIHPRSPFGGSMGNTYTNMEPIVLKYKGNPTQLEGDYTLYEGVFNYYKVPTTGQSNFSFTINNPHVDEENFSLYVIPLTVADNPVNGLVDAPYSLSNFVQYKWSRVKTFREMVNPNIYYIDEDSVMEGFPKIVFGNGLIGVAPTDTDVIYCEYFQTKGSAANNENLISLPPMNTVSAGTDQVFTFYSTGDLGVENKSKFSINNFDTSFQNTYNKSFGGSNLEDLDSIKVNAPRYYSSVGRAVTKNDYIYILKSFPGVGAINVIGGNELHPNDVTQLGHIYASVVPTIDMTNFLYNNNIYLSAAMESDIRTQLDDYAIISTKRHFYKPSYILVNVTPNIELVNNVTSTEKNKIKTQVKNLISSYFTTTFNNLGIPFRESKVSVSIDGLNYISSSYVDLVFEFIINNNTVANMVSGVNDVLYLPTQNLKDSSGNIIGTTNFIKTNAQVVKEDLYPSDWSILSTNFGRSVETTYNDLTTEEKAEYAAKLQLLNTYQNYMLPSQCSIYSENGLIVDNLTRYIYNSDFATIKVAEMWYVSGMSNLQSTTFPYLDKNKNLVSIAVVENEVEGVATKMLQFSYQDGSGVTNSYPVATIVEAPYGSTSNDIQLQLSPENIEWLGAYFGVSNSKAQFMFDGINGTKSPFKITRLSASRFSIELRVNSYLSELIMSGKNDLFDVAVDGAGTDITPTALTKNSIWNLKPTTAPSPFSELTMNVDGTPTTVGYVELSHKGLSNSANESLFQGFIGNSTQQLDYSTIVAEIAGGTSPYTTGQYFIVTDFIYVPNDTDPALDQYLYPNEVLFIDGDGELKASKVVKTISGSSPEQLATTFTQGDLFIDSTGESPIYYVFDEISPTYLDGDGVAYNYSTVTPLPYTGVDVNSYAVDPTQSLPTALVENTLVEIILSDTLNGSLASDGYAISYPSSLKDKIGHLYHRKVVGGVDSWVEMLDGLGQPQTKVKDGDLLLYSDSKWRLIENTNRSMTVSAYDPATVYNYDDVVTYSGSKYLYNNITPASGITPTDVTHWQVYVDRIQIGAELTSDLTTISATQYGVYKITTDITLSGATELSMFINAPTAQVLTSGDYIVCVAAPSTDYPIGQWLIYSGDVFQYQIDAANANSTFPIPLNVGSVLKVKAPIGTTAPLNFNGDTRLVSYADGSSIMYVGINNLGIPTWKPVEMDSEQPDYVVPTPFDPSVSANLGDIILIGDNDGNLGNDTTKVDAPMITIGTDSTMLFSYNDMLYFTGTQWIKAAPVNAYNVPNNPSLKDALNANGFNSDIMISQTGVDSFTVYMLDVFHNAVVGNLDYYTGKLTLANKVDKTLNKTTTVTGHATLSDIFKAENYRNSAVQMDRIRMKPVRMADSQSIDGNFDTNFNQYIVANVNDVQLR